MRSIPEVFSRDLVLESEAPAGSVPMVKVIAERSLATITQLFSTTVSLCEILVAVAVTATLRGRGSPTSIPLRTKRFTNSWPWARLFFHDSETAMNKGRGSGVSRLQALIAMGIFVATLLPGSVASANPSPKTTSEVFTYTCCSGSVGAHAYHPGEIIAVRWKRVASRETQRSPIDITLIVSATGPYASVAALRRAFAKAHPNYGRTNFEAKPIELSDTTPAYPVSSLRIPNNAGAGFYNLTEIVQKGLHFSSGKSIVTVRP